MRWAFAVVVLCVLLAGCGGKAGGGASKVRLADGTQVSLDVPEAQQPDPEGFRGVVSGVVVDASILPVPQAKVRIDGLDREVVADDTGRFVLEEVLPGLWTAVASKAGHDDGVGTLNVRAGEVTKAVLMAPRSPYQAPYHTTIVIDEFHSQANAVLVDEATEHVLALDLQPAGMVVEAYWDGLEAPLGEDALSYFVGAESDEAVLDEGTGPNPLLRTFAADWFPDGEYAVRVRVAPELGTLPAEASGRIFVTLFYVEAPPEGWSFVGGST